MYRCFVPPAQWRQAEATLSPEDSHHAARVRRLRIGELIELCDGQGRTAQAAVTAIGPGRIRVTIREDTRVNTPCPAVAITLIQALPKHDRLEWIIQKATELGIQAIQPVLTERVVVRPRAADATQRLARWQKIALEAAKQCGVSRLPEIHPLQSLADLGPVVAGFDFCYVASLGPQAQAFRAAVENARRSGPTRLALVIGPEGDLTDKETQLLREAGGRLVSFGRLILRTETAALYGLSVLKFAFGEL